jgi:hypothetical protein
MACIEPYTKRKSDEDIENLKKLLKIFTKKIIPSLYL